MKRILYVATVNPFVRGGGSQATLAYLDSVIELFGVKNVDVMIPDETIIPKEYQNNIKYIRIKNRGIEKYFQYINGYLSRFTKPLINYLTDNKKDYLLCIMNGSIKSGNAVKEINKLGIKTVVIHHNNEIEYHYDNKTIESLGGKFIFAIKKIQGNAYKYADVNLFLTKQDMDAFLNLYGNPKGINCLLGCYESKYTGKVDLYNIKKEYSLSVSGTLANYQTTNGILDYYTKYFNITKRLIPELKIVITGRDPSDEILQIQRDNPNNITIVSNPIDIFQIVQKAYIYLCPTNIGGGLKLRAMDGLKCGLPILIHEVSARGYDYFFNKPYFKVYNDEESFEKGLSELLLYLNHINEKNIQKDYQSFFGFENGTRRMKESLIKIIDKND